MRNTWMLDMYYTIDYLINLDNFWEWMYIHTFTLKFILPMELMGACISHSHICMFMQVSAHVHADGCAEQRSTSGAFSQEVLPVFCLETGSLSSLKSARLFEDGLSVSQYLPVPPLQLWNCKHTPTYPAFLSELWRFNSDNLSYKLYCLNYLPSPHSYILR